MNENKNNAKCPFCGQEMSFDLNGGTGLCLECKKQIDITKAKKLYESINKEDKSTEKKASYGEEYLEVERILDRVEFYLKNKQFDNAKEQLQKALDITCVDYRVYFGFVRAETKNFTDIRNTSHLCYLNKAISCADKEEKQTITRLYKDFYHKSQLTDEEYEQYRLEENQAKKDKLEGRLKQLIPIFMKQANMLKLQLSIAIIFFVIMSACLFLGFYFEIQLLMLVGVTFGALCYVFVRSYYLKRNADLDFNALLDLFDVIDNFQLSTNDKYEILEYMKQATKCFEENNSAEPASNVMAFLVKYMQQLNNQSIEDFLTQNNYYRKIKQ